MDGTVIIILAAMSGGIGYWANNWGRNGLGWFGCALLLSPLLTGIVLLFMGRSDELRAEIEAQHARRVAEYMKETPKETP